MNKIKLTINRDSKPALEFANRVARRLAEKRMQISIESQQLHSVGMMPDPNYEVIDIAKLSIASAIRVVQEASKEVKKSSFVLLTNPEHEGVQERIDREALRDALKETGATVYESENDVVDDISNRYNSLGMEINKDG